MIIDSKQYNDIPVIERILQVDREATKFDFDKMELSTDTENGLAQIPLDVVTEASNYNLSDYYVSHLAERRSFFKKLLPEQIMKWSNTLISKPLLNISEELSDVACQLHKNLLSYMGDRKTNRNPLHHIKKHIRLTLFAPEDLKDEAYIQVLKQISEHRDYDKTMRGWNFFAILASCYAPSSELYYSLINYLIYEVKNNLDQNIVKRANFILIRLVRSFEHKRKQIPSDQEILHIENMKSIMFPIFFFSETSTSVPTESYTTVRELKTTIMRKLQLNISRIPYYSLFEVCNKQDVFEERFLDDMDKVVDVTALWARETNEYSKRNQCIEFKIYLKIQLYYGYKDNDLDTITMHYVQTRYDVNNGKFNLAENDIVTLAAVQLLVNYGDQSHEEVFKYLEKNPERYVPINIFKSKDVTYWSQKIMELFATLKYSSKLEAKLTYLEHLKQNPLWEAHQYYCTYSKSFNLTNLNNFPENLILGIKPTGLSIQDMDRNELMFISYANIASWGVNNSVFVIVLQKNEAELNKYYFESNQTKMFQLLIEAYTNLIVGKSISEVVNSALENIKRFDTMPFIKLKEGETSRSRSATSYRK